MSSGFDMSGLPEGGTALDPSSLPEMGSVYDPNLHTNNATELLMERINPQLDRQREALRAQLANQGIAQGSSAYDNAMLSTDRRPMTPTHRQRWPALGWACNSKDCNSGNSKACAWVRLACRHNNLVN